VEQVDLLLVVRREDEPHDAVVVQQTLAAHLHLNLRRVPRLEVVLGRTAGVVPGTLAAEENRLVHVDPALPGDRQRLRAAVERAVASVARMVRLDVRVPLAAVEQLAWLYRQGVVTATSAVTAGDGEYMRVEVALDPAAAAHFARLFPGTTASRVPELEPTTSGDANAARAAQNEAGSPFARAAAAAAATRAPGPRPPRRPTLRELITRKPAPRFRFDRDDD
jgi:hypothetical protein